MSETFAKIKRHSKKVALFASLFLGAFLIAFYLINFDIKAATETVTTIVDDAPIVDTSVEISKRLGSMIGVESYDQWAKRFALTKNNNGLDQDPDGDGLPNYLEYAHGTNPLNADTDGDKFTDKQEITNGYDPDAPGDTKPQVEVSISKIGVDAPMVWSQSEDDQKMLKDLENGLSHFYQTSSPGQNGNAIISGHSSNYVWAKGDYNHIFKDLNNLEKGDIIEIRMIQKNGRILNYKYQVSEKFIAAADDERIFADTQEPTLTLTTCWPIGTALKRAIIKAVLVK